MRILATMLCLLVFTGFAPAQDLPEVKPGKAAPPDSVSDSIKQTLAPSGYSVTSDGNEILRIWLRKTIPTSAEDAPGYDSMREGTLVGVVEVKGNELTDFRDQQIIPGVYTLRLGLQPQDGNHMGVALYPEFLCLSPAKDDVKVDPIAHDPLMDLSKKASGSGHPVVLFMQPFLAQPDFDFPAVNENQDYHVVLNVVTEATLADGKKVRFPIGIIIMGVSDAI